MPIIIKNLNGTRRVELIEQADADQLVDAGRAAPAVGYPGIYEEATPGEMEQGYMTRSMVPLNPAKKRGRPASKTRQEPDASEEAV